MSYKIKLTIPSDTGYLELLRRLMSAAAKLTGRRRFPHNAERDCKLALVEVVDNAIFHAHHHLKNKPIDIWLSVENSCIKISVADKGSGFKYKKPQEPDLTATKGRGLYMISRLMSKVSSKKISGGHKLEMKYKI